jgi:hypothetical protein
MAMFVNTKHAPVRGGLIRSGIGTKLYLVFEVLPYNGHWVVGCEPVGRLDKGKWVPILSPRTGGYGGTNGYVWKEVYSRSQLGFHPVRPGPDCPEAAANEISKMLYWYEEVLGAPLV